MIRRVLVALSIAVVTVTLLPAAAIAEPKLKLPDMSNLEHKATDHVNITIGPAILGLAGWAMDHEQTADAAARDVLKGIEAVYVRSYKFATDFAYSMQDIEAVRQQLRQPGWSQLAEVRNRAANEAVDIYMAIEHGKTTGLAIVTSEPREFTIVNVVGSVDLKNLHGLSKEFGLKDVPARPAK